MGIPVRDPDRKSLRWKIVVPVWACVALLAIILSLLVQSLVGDLILDCARREVVTHASYLVSGLPENPDPDDIERLDSMLRAAVQKSDALGIAVYRAVDQLGVMTRVTVQCASDSTLERFPTSIRQPTELVSFETHDTDAGAALHIGTAVRLEQGKVVGAIRLVSTLGMAGARVDVIYAWNFGIALAFFVIAMVLASQLSGMIERPIARITERVRELVRGHYDGSLVVTETAQLHMLANKLNGLAHKLRGTDKTRTFQIAGLHFRLSERSRMLEEAYLDMQSLDRAKDAFLSNLSHEMRTPLTSILAASEILSEFPDETLETKTEFIEIINLESKRLMKLIGKLLDLAKLEAQMLQLHVTEVDIGQLAEETAAQLFARPRDKSVALSIGKPNEPIYCECDKERISHVIHSMVEGAFWFSPDDGTVRMIITRDAEHVTLSIEDDCTDSEGRFTDMFDDHDDAETAHVLLGHPIARRLAKAHGGTLQHRSSDTGGTVVELHLPIKNVAERLEPGAGIQPSPRLCADEQFLAPTQ